MILEIKKYPDKILKRKCRPVGKLTGEVKNLIADMFETMYMMKGVGLAANQVGRNLRLCVIDPRGPDGEKNPMVLINPVVVKKSRQKITFEEGCLSFPDITASVTRPVKVTISALNQEFAPLELEADGLVARILQHEIDHLDGKTFLDRLPPLKRIKAYFLYHRNRRKK